MRPSLSSPKGVTLIETLVATVILALILIILLQMITLVSQSWKHGAADAWGPAQEVFSHLAREISSATLEPYQDYVDLSGQCGSGIVPDHPARCSDLAFICGPNLFSGNRITSGDGIFFITERGYSQTEAHRGLDHLLNAEGYEVEFTNDAGPYASQPNWRWRLKQILQPSENLAVFTTSSSASFLKLLVPSGTLEPTLTDNIITLLILPERAAADHGPDLAPAFLYDSRDAAQPLTHHQLPPRIELVLVAIDEVSAQLLAARCGTLAPPLIEAKLFQRADDLATDLTTLDASLTRTKIDHRIYERDILLTGAAWTETPSP